MPETQTAPNPLPATPQVEPPAETKEQFLERLNAKNARITQLETENTQLRPKATTADQTAAQLQTAQQQLGQASTALNYYRSASHLGMRPEAIDHLAGTYAAQQQALPEAQRQPWAQWLNNAFANPGGLDPVAGAVVREHLASRSGSAVGSAPVPPAAPAAPGPVGAAPTPTPPVTPPWIPAVPPPAANAGVVGAPPSPVAMSEQDIAQLVRDPKAFKEWREKNPEAWNRINRKR
jgi:hypothetical protein